ncbi:glycine/betaine ABC transporter [Bombilactobacillus bombi]|uniref:Glycine/betaine ABC transporter n=1 Tax=Bombilactobacillus bombi TaxID=1303590 RepID=A0A417ZB34_9LACO|nr:glycine betaine ABC transporter substrate-binding protein [Bombilactobacillus bombi]MCO6540895.1 glycine/betaine ABC transporter [Lactobacillus sp.]RHW47846.1 glycine/betaine ABC transporter [Bombilactobacillus bombi]RHW52025.1 glycine/betaine ABC transporter [Bombilactobacillus bombi]
MKKKLLLWLTSLSLVLILVGCNGAQLPKYQSHKSLGPQINYTITGIEAGSGIMGRADQALTSYHLKSQKWQLMTSSTAAMISTLDKATKNKQPIVVTAWQPHWMVEKYNLKFLKDPKHVFGKGESMRTVARLGLKKDNPGVYQFLKNFHWQLDEATPLMMKINSGVKTETAVKDYINQHPQQIKAWLQNVPAGNGKKVTLVYTPFDYEVAATNLVKKVLTDHGYKVDMRQLDVGIMWSALSSKSADATVVAELPVTQGLYEKKYHNKIDVVRSNLPGAKTGLAVPKYMKNINTIDDLKNK